MAEIPLYGLFETAVTNDTKYENPFLVELNATFTRGARSVEFFGFHDGDGRGAQQGNAWKLRFMPDEPGKKSVKVGAKVVATPLVPVLPCPGERRMV